MKKTLKTLVSVVMLLAVLFSFAACKRGEDTDIWSSALYLENTELGEGSNASYAIRFAASFEGVAMVLSGMGSVDMVKDNVSYMKNFVPLSEREMEGVFRVADVFRAQNLIQCTACNYCTERCPKNIPIPGYFACYNATKTIGGWSYYSKLKADNVQGKIDDCIECGACERACPQHLKIPSLLKEVRDNFEKKD